MPGMACIRRTGYQVRVTQILKSMNARVAALCAAALLIIAALTGCNHVHPHTVVHRTGPKVKLHK